MTEITVDNGQSFSERDLYAEKILLLPLLNFDSRAAREKRDVEAALKRIKVAEHRLCNLSGTAENIRLIFMRRFFIL